MRFFLFLNKQRVYSLFIRNRFNHIDQAPKIYFSKDSFQVYFVLINIKILIFFPKKNDADFEEKLVSVASDKFFYLFELTVHCGECYLEHFLSGCKELMVE